MEELMNLWDQIVDAYGEDTVRELAEEAGIDLSIIGADVDDEWAPGAIADLIDLVVDQLAAIDGDKAVAILRAAGLSEGDINKLLS